MSARGCEAAPTCEACYIPMRASAGAARLAFSGLRGRS